MSVIVVSIPVSKSVFYKQIMHNFRQNGLTLADYVRNQRKCSQELNNITYLYFPGRILKYICLIRERLTSAMRPVSVSRSPSSVPSVCSSTTLYVSVIGCASSKLLTNLTLISIISRIRTSSILPLYRINILDNLQQL